MNPDPYGQALKLNVSEVDNALDLELVRSVCTLFRVRLNEADDTIARFKAIIRQWPTLAHALRIPRIEQALIGEAFKLSHS
jgi:serine/threonine-protein kinase HipA